MVNQDYKLVCGEDKCTACGACVQICPKKCIVYQANSHETLRAVVDKNNCIECKLCQAVCPQLNVIDGKKSKECYAGWSNIVDTRLKSASGGIATELYRYYAEHDGYYAGVVFDELHQVKYELLTGKENYNAFQSSKYVYSDTKNVFVDIATVLLKNKNVLFIGLPCQVAGLQRYLKVRNIDCTKLSTVDLVCHGTTPNAFLKEHIKYVEKKKKNRTQEVRFRDPEFGTHFFVFSLYENEKAFYHKRVNRNDSYQIGYHAGITYRDNCYECRYANERRMGDITLADFSGVGKLAPCNYTGRNVSCILINNEKGKVLVETLIKDGYIYCDSRPIEEELNTEKQLHRPTEITKERIKFLKLYESGNSFEKAMKKAGIKIILKNEIIFFIHIEEIKNSISKYIPSNVKNMIKHIFIKA